MAFIHMKNMTFFLFERMIFDPDGKNYFYIFKT